MPTAVGNSDATSFFMSLTVASGICIQEASERKMLRLCVAPDTFCPQVLQSTAPIAFTADTLWGPDRMKLPFTKAQAQVWEWIASLGAGEHKLDMSFGQCGFKWWLWVATVEQSSGAVVGTGIDRARVWTNGTDWAEFSFERCDGSTYKATLTLRSNGGVVLQSTP